MPGKVISLVNLKGGVGKTALAVNVGVSLAADWGKKVLVVDLDPQGNASIWLMGMKDYVNRANDHKTKTVYGLLCHDEPVGECLVKSPVKSEDGVAESWVLDLMPATYHLMFFEETFQPDEGKPPPYVWFYQQLKVLKDIYDYILIDCAPNIYKGTKCAVFAADYILVPCNPDALSWIGLELLAKRIHRFCQQNAGHLGSERTGQPLPLVSGVIMNDVHTTHTVTIKLSETHFQKRLSDLRARELVRTDAQVLRVTVSHAAAFQTGTYGFKPLLFASSPNEKLLADYRSVANILLQKV